MSKHVKYDCFDKERRALAKEDALCRHNDQGALDVITINKFEDDLILRGYSVEHLSTDAAMLLYKKKDTAEFDKIMRLLRTVLHNGRHWHHPRRFGRVPMPVIRVKEFLFDIECGDLVEQEGLEYRNGTRTLDDYEK